MLVLPATMLAVRRFHLVVIRLSGLSRLGTLGSVGLPGSVGPSLAFTVTVRSAVAVLPALSETVYASTYSPGFAAFTEPDTLTASVTSPSTSSVADTPANGSNSESCSIVTSSTPESTGAVVSAGGTGFF